ncbi:Large subunit GTPase 1-like protein [Rhynchospora pubera]|uniref:Large subunit GTPase 1-like protein n=1 Tax=Rhynchospora pubera TaxID=906938 RepID=A0AAV8F537_9POAL|nr:Large subunit GTPase 1-like protein [Rhynchospora pubera]
MGGKKERTEGLGRALIKQQNRKAIEAKEKGRAIHLQNRKVLESYTEINEIDAIIDKSDEASVLLSGGAASDAGSSDLLISADDAGDMTAEERRQAQKEEEALHASNLKVPRRPPWNSNMSVEELDANEKQAFLEWRRKLARLEENDMLVLTPYEKNLDIWRQLWRVLERSDLIVMVVDARDPFFYRCPDLEEYALEIDEHKRTLLLVNKADLLPFNIRKKWAEYFHQHDILFIFWSAKAASAAIEGKTLIQEPESQESDLPGLDTRIYGRDELLTRLQAEAESVVAARERPSSSSSTTSEKRQVTVGFVGYPNVGKSSTINALVGAKRTGVTSTPGKTKHFQTLIISDELVLCDCPGLVFPSFSSSRHEMVACGVLPIDRMTQHREAVQVVANRVARRELERIYNIRLPNPKPYEPQNRPPTSYELLRAYCVSRGHVASSGLPDETRAARQMLKDYIDGKLPHFELPPGTDTSDTEGEDSGSGSDEEGEPEPSSGSLPDKRELEDLEEFDSGFKGSKVVKKRENKKEGSHKQHKKPQRKKDRSWRVGNDGGDGMPAIRVFQKPAVNFAAISANGSG